MICECRVFVKENNRCAETLPRSRLLGHSVDVPGVESCLPAGGGLTLQGNGCNHARTRTNDKWEALLQVLVFLQALELQHFNMECLSHLYLLSLMAVC